MIPLEPDPKMLLEKEEPVKVADQNGHRFDAVSCPRNNTQHPHIVIDP